jgi:hypothetical protein
MPQLQKRFNYLTNYLSNSINGDIDLNVLKNQISVEWTAIIGNLYSIFKTSVYS